MRQGQNKRPRNRSNGRKNSNPLTRHYDSNGPDVKVRGVASHIAERYVQLARDASSAGDSVMAENYFQHAEHYNRIISSAQAHQQATQNARNNDNRNRHGAQDSADGDNASTVAQPSSDGLAAVPDNVEREEFNQAKQDDSAEAVEKPRENSRESRGGRSRTRRRSAPKDIAAKSEVADLASGSSDAPDSTTDPSEAPQPSIMEASPKAPAAENIDGDKTAQA